MKTRLLRSSALEELRDNISNNLQKYRFGSFEELLLDASYSFEYDLEIEVDSLRSLASPIDIDDHEVENCAIVFSAIPGLSPYEARDERLWVYLSHTHFLAHARLRWPIPIVDIDAAAHIEKHFFAKDKRQAERDNVASRLWWMAYLCSRVKELDLRSALQALLFRSDVRANIIERPTTSQSEALFCAFIKTLSRSYKGEQALFERKTFRRFMKEINSIGGAKLLETLSADETDVILDDVIKNRLKLTAI